MKRFLLSTLSILFLLAGCAAAQTQAEIDRTFRKALNDYDKGLYDQALSAFTQIAKEIDPNLKTTASFVFIAKTLLGMEQYDKVKVTVREFIKSYPASKYVDEAKMVLADAYYSQGKSDSTIYTLLSIISGSSQPEYKNSAKETAERLLINSYKPEKIESFINASGDEETTAFLYLTLGKKLLYNGNLNGAKQRFVYVMQKFPDTPEFNEASYVYRHAEDIMGIGGEKSLFAVLLPLNKESGAYDAVNMILEGIKYAVHRYNVSHTDRVGLLIKNTENDKTKIEKLYYDLSAYDNLRMVLGPAFSMESINAAGIMKPLNIPLISPTATEDRIYKNHDNIFQANPTFEMRGRLMANYLFEKLGKRNIAVLFSKQGYSFNLAFAFSDEFKRLGGTVVMMESYPMNSIDLTDVIRKVTQAQVDIDGLYLPVSHEKVIPVLMAGMINQHLSLPIYGNQDWMKAANLDNFHEICDSLIFTSDYYVDYEDPEYRELNDDFKIYTRNDLSRFALYGYDMTAFVLNLHEFYSFDGDLFNLLKNSPPFAGLHNNIQFGDEHVNKFLNIVSFKEGKFYLLEKYTAEGLRLGIHEEEDNSVEH